MAAPLLRHYAVQVGTANAWTIVVPAVTTGRALAVSKLTVTAPNASMVFAIAVTSPTPASPGIIVSDSTLGPGEVYTETGLVVLAGETIQITTSIINGRCNVFGQEVDNV